jgi:recombination protein RecA
MSATRQRVRSTEGKPSQSKPSGLPKDVIESMQRIEKVHNAKLVREPSDSGECNRIPSGCFMIDFALLGGFPQGYITMLYGYESCGKTTACLKGIAEYQKKHPDKVVGWIDAEGLFDSEWAERLGVDTARLIMAYPDYGEQAVDILDDWMTVKSIGLIVIDSLPALIPMKMLDQSTEDDLVAAHPRLMGKMCSKITSGNTRERREGHWITIWNINQFRSKVGFVLGSPLTLPGGRQINHIPSTKLWLKLKKEHMGKDENGVEVHEYSEQAFKFEKTKHGSSIKEGEYQLYLNPSNEKGLPEGSYDNVAAVMPFAKKYGFVTGGGKAWTLHTRKTSEKFGSLSEIENFLYKNEEELHTLMRSVIAHQRKSKGHEALPPDGYLVSRIGRLVELE